MADGRRRAGAALRPAERLHREVAARQLNDRAKPLGPLGLGPLGLAPLALALLALACAPPAAAPQPVGARRDAAVADGAAVARIGRPVMGTILEVRVHADDPAAARRMAEEALRLARHWEDVLTTWRDDGQLARLNAAAGSGWRAVSADLAMALDQMTLYWRLTGGAFDPAVGATVRRLREGGAAPAGSLPSLGSSLARRDGAAKLAAGVELDAGGIGKGLALDRMAVALREGGAHAALLDFGGSSQLAFGSFAGGAPLVIAAGLRPGVVHGAIPLDGLSLSTSRSLGAESAGRIVDPRDGEPVAAPRMATVAGRSATAAEAWSTALVVLGRPGLARASEHGLEVLYEDSAGLVVTPGFPLIRGQGPGAGDQGR